MKTINGFTYADIGTISEATMRNEDLIPTFLDELSRLAQANNNKAHMDLVATIQGSIFKGESEINPDIEDDYNKYFESDNAGFDLESLFDALNEYALPYFYFGSHPGNGSDYGYWLSEDFENDFDGLKVNDTSEVPNNYNGEVLHVNDHGNLTLYVAKNGKLTEIWGIV